MNATETKTLYLASEWHLKPAGVSGPCPICKCPAKRLKAKHRLSSEGFWEKKVKVCFGTDWSIETAHDAR